LRWLSVFRTSQQLRSGRRRDQPEWLVSHLYDIFPTRSRSAYLNSLAGVYRELIITLAERHRLPAVYCFRYFATGGGLLSYGPDTVDPFRRAAEYFSK